MVSDSSIEYGVFKAEIKNRFLCTVNVDGTDTICYIPSSCRLSNFIDLVNKKVMLRPIKKKDARTKYSVYAVKYRQCYVLLDLSSSNKIIAESLDRRIFAFLGSRKKFLEKKLLMGTRVIYISWIQIPL